MVFSDTTAEDGLIQEVDRICNSSNTTYSLKAKTARLNIALDRFITLALMYDLDWIFDDVNYTDLPIGTTDIVSGQQDYSFASDVLMVIKVLAKNNAGNWQELVEVDNKQWASRDIWTLPTGNSGSPSKFAVIGNSILLDSIPNYASTAGLKVFFKRNASKFISTDTTKSPGIPSVFHPYLTRYAALPYLIEKKLPWKRDVAEQIRLDEEAIKEWMSSRSQTGETVISTIYRNPR